MKYAPIALFIYNRPDHARRTLQSLKSCPEFCESPLYIFCDGPKKPEDQANVQRARDISMKMAGDHATFVLSDNNKGLANSIIAGVNRLCTKYGRVIVVEDDLLVGHAFLTYLNAALDRYSDNQKVMQVSAYMYPVPAFKMKKQALFLPYTASCGWATWESSWQLFDKNANGWQQLKDDTTLKKRFNLGGTFKYASMLEKQMRGESDSWAIRWYWSVFKNNGLVLFPPRSYVQNIGFDGSGTNGWLSNLLMLSRNSQPEDEMIGFPSEVAVNYSDFEKVKNIILSLKKGSLSWLKGIIKGIFYSIRS